MAKDADKSGKLTVGMRDSRITSIGYFLRKYKLDEFPQFINVLNGTMSVVGPRPEVQEYVDLYSGSQLEVLKVKPGITDLASLEYFIKDCETVEIRVLYLEFEDLIFETRWRP